MENEKDIINLGRMIIRQSDLEISVTYKNDVFVMKFATPSVQAAIENEIARRLGGFQRSAFSFAHIANVEACALIDYTLIPGRQPKWFQSIWTCYDEDLIAALYEGYLTFRNIFREKMRNGGFEEGGATQRT